MKVNDNPDLAQLACMVESWVKEHPNQAGMKTSAMYSLSVLETLSQAGALLALALEDEEGVYHGCLIAVVSGTLHSPELEAVQLAFVVSPAKRSYKTVKALLDKYIQVSASMGCPSPTLSNTGGYDYRIELLYKRAGFLKAGTLFKYKE